MDTPQNEPTAPRPSHNAGKLGVVIIIAVALVGFGLMWWKRHSMSSGRHHKAPAVVLTGPTASLDLGNNVKLELVRIEPGTFTMGSPENEPDRDISEGPQHQVTIKRPFYIGKFEVTQGQWKVLRGLQSHANVGDDFPADGISWNDATNWCADLSKKLGVTVRLPTEAEWEYACRAGTTTPFAFGPALSAEQANLTTGPTPSTKKTWTVGSGKPNAWGLYDMHGNVWEWCQDTLNGDYMGAPADGSAWVDQANKFNRVRRGGSWMQKARECRSAVRYGSASSEKEPDLRNEEVGFRVVVDVPAGRAGAKTKADTVADEQPAPKKRKRKISTTATSAPTTAATAPASP